MKIFSNLLSNAIKFTPEGGEIQIRVRSNKETLIIDVEDNGVGISEKQMPYVFDRFYQVDASSTRPGEGTGIGLALTKELVHLLDGDIQLRSTLGQGTCFTVQLPIRKASATTVVKADMVPRVDPALVTLETTLNLPNESKEKVDKPLLLIVEDNADVAQYIIACLKGLYRLELAADGQEGIEKAIELVPDLIVSDVMMPRKDGFELCDTLKRDERTSHIPIILLTAKADFDARMSGFEKGADAYLTKPFEPKELLVRLKNLLDIRKKLQERYAQITIEPSTELKVEELPDIAVEDAFIQKIRGIIEEHLVENEFGVPALSKAVNMSRSQLFRKIKALTGKSPSLFIRSVRLVKAKELIQSTDLTISEIAYDVGFSSPTYFSNAFLEEFGLRPVSLRG